MKIVASIVGALLGIWMLGGYSRNIFGEMVVGACLGYLIATVTEQGRRLRKLEEAPSPVQQASDSDATPPMTTPVAVEPPSVVAPVESEPAALETPEEVVTGTAMPATSVSETTESRIFNFFREFFTGGQAIPRIGVVVLFFGVAFLLKYAAEHSLLPIELRLTGAALGAVVLLGFGWRLRERRNAYALALQGGGIGLLYLTVFAAWKLYGLIPPLAAFAVLVAVCGFSGVLAVLQNARVLAVVGAAGGFLAPVLISTGQGNHVMLFSYYALLNAGILGIAWFRAWRELNLLGFAFTFVIGVLWGAQHYRPELFATTEPFLILFFFFYVFVAVLFALRQPVDLRGYVDGTLVFGVPVVGFGLQAVLVQNYEYGLAWSATGAGAFYLVLATLLFRSRPTMLRLLCEAFLALGVVFATLALPLALDGRWSSAAWAMEGAAMVWIGLRQSRQLARIFGALLLFGASVLFLDDFDRKASGMAVMNSVYLGGVIIALAALFAARIWEQAQARLGNAEQLLPPALFALGLTWWVGGGLREIVEFAPAKYVIDVIVVGLALSCVLAEWLGARIDWRRLRGAAFTLLPGGLLLVAAAIVMKSHPFVHFGAAAWAVFVLGHAWLLWRAEALSWPRVLDWWHGATLWWLASIVGAELYWLGGLMVSSGSVWAQVSGGLAPVLVVALAAHVRVDEPWSRHREAWLTIGALPLLAAACVWLIAANIDHAGDPVLLPYVPLLNPLDIVSALVLVVVLERFLSSRHLLNPDTWGKSLELAWGLIGALTFLWLNAALLRTLHHWVGVPFDLYAMLNSVLVQASLSIFWTSLAFAAMFVGRSYGLRVLWFVGAALLAVVVVKLFAIDLARTGTLARIVSFIVVGVLLLLIGYLAPVPPKAGTEEAAS